MTYVECRDKLKLSKDRYQYTSIDISCRATSISFVHRRDSSYILTSHSVKLEYKSKRKHKDSNFSVVEADYYLFRGQWEWDIQNVNGTNQELDEYAVPRRSIGWSRYYFHHCPQPWGLDLSREVHHHYYFLNRQHCRLWNESAWGEACQTHSSLLVIFPMVLELSLCVCWLLSWFPATLLNGPLKVVGPGPLLLKDMMWVLGVV